MSATIIKFDVNHKGIGELLVCDGLQRDIKARADRVVAAARAAYPDMEYKVDNMTGRRARYWVIADEPKGMNVEAKHRVLGNAMDAAR
jgi:hypothetical protein